MSTLTYSGNLTVVSCWCGIKHAIPVELYRVQQNDPKQVAYCPLGHQYVADKSRLGQLQAELERSERRLAAERDTSRRWRENAEAERRSAIAYKGHLTRVRRRITNGVCPVPGCKRSGFTQVLRHIATQHPDWLHEHPEVRSDG